MVVRADKALAVAEQTEPAVLRRVEVPRALVPYAASCVPAVASAADAAAAAGHDRDEDEEEEHDEDAKHQQQQLASTSGRGEKELWLLQLPNKLPLSVHYALSQTDPAFAEPLHAVLAMGDKAAACRRVNRHVCVTLSPPPDMHALLPLTNNTTTHTTARDSAPPLALPDVGGSASAPSEPSAKRQKRSSEAGMQQDSGTPLKKKKKSIATASATEAAQAVNNSNNPMRPSSSSPSVQSGGVKKPMGQAQQRTLSEKMTTTVEAKHAEGAGRLQRMQGKRKGKG
eukprot:jgi/Chlat1/5859/Chrsp4S06368